MMTLFKCVCSSISLLFVLIPDCSWSQGKAGQVAEYLRWGVGGRALGLGRAFTSVADDASAVYWNPAGMSSLAQRGGTMMFMHVGLQQGASLNYIGGALPLRLFFVKNTGKSAIINAIEDLKIGGGFLWHSLGSFDFYDAEARPLQEANTTIGESALLVSISYPLSRLGLSRSEQGVWWRELASQVELGFTSKFLHQNLFGQRGSARSYDLGLRYSHSSGLLNLGITLKDFNSPEFAYKTKLKGDRLPAHAIAGISLIPPFDLLRGLLFSFDYLISPPANREPESHFGMEYDFSVLNNEYPITLRLGTNSSQDRFTVGLQFSPEGLFDQDWLPSGDWTYSDSRSGLDAAGLQYSFSIDRNPFTARYWYLSGEKYLSDVNEMETEKIQQIERNMVNACAAANPGDRAYRYEAALRLADVRFLSCLSEMGSGESAVKLIPHKFSKIISRYQDAGKYLRIDYGKQQVDYDTYFRSFFNYSQSLILAGQTDEAARMIAEQGAAWGKEVKLNVIEDPHRRTLFFDYINYLQAYALYANGKRAEASAILEKTRPIGDMGRFLLAHIQFIQGNYGESLRNLSAIDLNKSVFPQGITLPITFDRTYGDETLFLSAICHYKLSFSKEKYKELLVSLAKIPRFFPSSELAGFLMNGEGVLDELIEVTVDKDIAATEILVEKLIKAYMETSLNGTLIEELYTFNYR